MQRQNYKLGPLISQSILHDLMNNNIIIKLI